MRMIPRREFPETAHYFPMQMTLRGQYCSLMAGFRLSFRGPSAQRGMRRSIRSPGISGIKSRPGLNHRLNSPPIAAIRLRER